MKSVSYESIQKRGKSFTKIMGRQGRIVVYPPRANDLSKVVSEDLDPKYQSPECLDPVLPEVLHVLLKNTEDFGFKDKVICASGELFARKSDGRKFLWAVFWHKVRHKWCKKPLWLHDVKGEVMILYFEIEKW